MPRDVSPEEYRDFEILRIRKMKNPTARERAYARHNGRCNYCGQIMVLEKTASFGMCCTLDHVIPKTRGGNGLPNNRAACCERCNGAKGNLRPSEFAKTLYGRRAAHLKELTELAMQLHKSVSQVS